MNIYDISKQAGVSIATVSRVLNNSSHVSEKTRKRVLEVMENCGYTPNAFARGLGLNTMKTVGILCADASDIYLANAIYVVETELQNRGYNSFLCCTGYDLHKKKIDLDLLLSKRVDAVILIGSNYVEKDSKDNEYIITASKQVPVMIINGYLEANHVYCCLTDDYQATYDITHKLIKKGAKHLIYLYRSESYSGRQKLKGFVDAFAFCNTCSHEELRSHGEVIDTINVLETNKMGVDVDAIICSDDEIAIGALKWANQHNIKVPKDLSIVGYNNSKYAKLSTPELTSIDNHGDVICRNIVNMLIQVFNNENVPRKTIISCDFVERETTR